MTAPPAADALERLTPWLFARTAGGVRWGLERTRELLADVGDPHRAFRSLHIGGTNGKGSVAALAAAALRESRAARGGGPVGLYTSPHLVSFSERMGIDGAPAPDEMVLAAAERLRPAIERTGATFFEATTAIAFLCFAEAGVEVAAIEVGLGGRLDATNVVTPMACAITNISLEHTDHLGDTIPAIAREKAGILKHGVPAVTGIAGGAGGDEGVGEALRAIREAAESVGAPLHELDRIARVELLETTAAGTTFRLESRAWGDRTLRLPMPGEHQARNAALAAELLALLPREVRPDWSSIDRGFGGVKWPGRLQVERIRGTTWVFDVAHNPAGAETLAAALDRFELPRPHVLLFGALADKDVRAMLHPLLSRVDAAVLTSPDGAPADRRWNPSAAAADLAAEDAPGPPLPRPRVIPNLHEALRRAATLAPHGTIIVTGSFHTVGEALSRLDVRI